MPLSPSSRASSSLSSHSDDEFDDETPPASDVEETEHDRAMAAMPPAKRRRLAPQSEQSPFTHDSPTSTVTGRAGLELPNGSSPLQEDEDISSDSSGSVPGSPRAMNLQNVVDEETLGSEQVHVCAWDGCPAGDLGNQDELVRHVHDEHVGQAKRAKYSCEWADCKAKGKTQLSAYALRAHMRSHTKEKPFYCELPECDKSFTRSDALAKHMRTVHENEAVKSEAKRNANGVGRKTATPTSAVSPAPSQQQHQANPASNNSTTGSSGNPKPAKSLKLVFNSNKTSTPPNSGSSKDREETTDTQDPLSPSQRDAVLGPFPEDLQFTPSEASLPRNDLYRLLRRQIRWATEDSAALTKEVEAAEARRKTEWFSKELVLENVLEAEFAKAERKGLFKSGSVEGSRSAGGGDDFVDIDFGQGQNTFARMEFDAGLASKLPMKGHKSPWYRDESQRNVQRARTIPQLDGNGIRSDLPKEQKDGDTLMVDNTLQQDDHAEAEAEAEEGFDDTEPEWSRSRS